MSFQKTTIIINNLSREDFVKSEGNSMSLTDEIKLSVLNLPINGAQMISHISHWSTLPFLSRVIIILTEESTAKSVYEYIKREYNVNVSLQENLLARSKSADSINSSALSVESDLQKFKEKYEDLGYTYDEPEPKVVNGEKGKSPTRTLFRPVLNLAIDSSAKSYQSPESPTITLNETF